MRLVVDASVVAASLIDSTSRGAWARSCLREAALAAPHLMPAEAASVLRRATLRGEISVEVAAIANADLLDLSIELYAFEKYAFRVWQLRDNLAVYDAWYVALAESLEASLATLDQRLATATGPTCEFVTPP